VRLWAANMTGLRRLLVWAGALTALGLTFAAYLNPHMVVDLSNRVWACF
jgi:hypothetical protein